MNIPFQQFEQFIDEVILKRGLSYFRNGRVSEPEEITRGQFESIVEGTDDYRVIIQTENDIVTDFSCTCPYDHGPVCKHVAAVLFALQQDVLEIKPKRRKKGTSASGKRGRKTVAEQVDSILKELTLDDLALFIREHSLRDTDFRRKFLSAFSNRAGNESKSFYAQQIRSVLRSVSDRHGFVDWQAARFVGKAVNEMLAGAKSHLEKGHLQSTLFICCAVFEELTKALQFSDDSNGEIGGPIYEASELLAEAVTKELPEESREWLMKYTLTAFEKNIFEGWDWHLHMISLASMLYKNDNEAEKVLALLERETDSEFQYDKMQAMKFDLLKRTGKEEEADAFIEENIGNPDLRRRAIEELIQQKKYDQATAIAEEGVSFDRGDKPGLADNWVDWQLRIALKQKNKEKIIEHARYLFTDSIRDKDEYYRILKSTVDPGQWDGFVKVLVNDIESRGNWRDEELLPWIFIREEWWDRLLEVVSRSTWLPHISHYETYLRDLYPKELANLYTQGIREAMEQSTGRKHYQEVCRYLRRMKKLGAKNEVSQLVEELRKKYPQRRALLEELSLV